MKVAIALKFLAHGSCQSAMEICTISYTLLQSHKHIRPQNQFSYSSEFISLDQFITADTVHYNDEVLTNYGEGLKRNKSTGAKRNKVFVSSKDLYWGLINNKEKR